MKRFQLLLTLIVALAATACTGDAGQDSSATFESTAPAVTASRPATAVVAQDTAVSAVQDSTTPEVEATEAAPTLAPALTEPAAAAVLPVIGPAPGWDNDVWINSETPLPLEALRGKVVLLEFWTFG